MQILRVRVSTIVAVTALPLNPASAHFLSKLHSCFHVYRRKVIASTMRTIIAFWTAKWLRAGPASIVRHLTIWINVIRDSFSSAIELKRSEWLVSALGGSANAFGCNAFGIKAVMLVNTRTLDFLVVKLLVVSPCFGRLNFESLC